MNSTDFVIEHGAYGPRMVVTGAWTDGHAKHMRQQGIEDLYLNYARGWKGTNLTFLDDLEWLKAFTILDWNIMDVSPVHNLKELRMLEVSTYCDTELRFESFPSLVECKISWREKARSLFSAKSIKRLFVSDYTSKDADLFGQMSQLVSLSIAGGSLQSVVGLRPLRELTFLGLYNLTRLKSLQGVESLTILEALEVNDCPALSEIAALAPLTKLRRVELNDDGKIASIQPIGKLLELREFYFFGTTEVQDGDLSPLAVLPHLEKTSFQNRPHYNRRREELVH
jgi:Leucine-rich repeat (LRR) protein